MSSGYPYIKWDMVFADKSKRKNKIQKHLTFWNRHHNYFECHLLVYLMRNGDAF